MEDRSRNQRMWRPRISARRKWLIYGAALLVIAFSIAVYVVQIQPELSHNTAGIVSKKTPPGKASTPIAFTTPNCGVRKNADGSYHFSRLHTDTIGDVVDDSGCVAHLLGLNMGGLFLSTAFTPDATSVAWYKRTFQINIARVDYNAYWWNTDVYVPKYGMHFRQLLQGFVKNLEANGIYVELDNDTAFTEPPCGNDYKGVQITFCPSQDQGRKDYHQRPSAQTAQELEEYQPTALQALSSLSKLYANDAAVLFNVWNEPGKYIFALNDVQHRVPYTQARIGVVRANDPQALIFVFATYPKEDGMYSEANLVFDFHVYPTFAGVSPATHTSCQTTGWNYTTLQSFITPLRLSGRASIIGEWGHCYDDPAYNQQILSIALANNAGLIYFHAGEVAQGPQDSPHINANGVLVQKDYETIYSHK